MRDDRTRAAPARLARGLEQEDLRRLSWRGMPSRPQLPGAPVEPTTAPRTATAPSTIHQRKVPVEREEDHPPRISSHHERLWQLIRLHTNNRIMRHIPTHSRSGCAAICAIGGKTSRYMTHDPGNESNSAPSRLLMVHGSTHFAPKTRERTYRYDERTQGIDIRTRLGCERTRVSRRNPSGQLVAGW